MASTSIIINSTDGFGKSVQKAMTCVNPKSTNEELAALGQMITAAQNHSYQETIRIDKTNCDLEQGVVKKAVPTIVTKQAIMGDNTLKVAYNGDGELKGVSAPPNGSPAEILTNPTSAVVDGETVYTFQMQTAPEEDMLIVVYAAQTDNFAAAVHEISTFEEG